MTTHKSYSVEQLKKRSLTQLVSMYNGQKCTVKTDLIIYDLVKSRLFKKAKGTLFSLVIPQFSVTQFFNLLDKNSTYLEVLNSAGVLTEIFFADSEAFKTAENLLQNLTNGAITKPIVKFPEAKVKQSVIDSTKFTAKKAKSAGAEESNKISASNESKPTNGKKYQKTGKRRTSVKLDGGKIVLRGNMVVFKLKGEEVKGEFRHANFNIHSPNGYAVIRFEGKLIERVLSKISKTEDIKVK